MGPIVVLQRCSTYRAAPWLGAKVPVLLRVHHFLFTLVGSWKCWKASLLPRVMVRQIMPLPGAPMMDIGSLSRMSRMERSGSWPLVGMLVSGVRSDGLSKLPSPRPLMVRKAIALSMPVLRCVKSLAWIEISKRRRWPAASSVMLRSSMVSSTVA